MSKGLFIVGTGTDVGKTYVTGVLLKKLNEAGYDVGYFKAAMSGNERDVDGKLIPGDAKKVMEMSGSSQSLESTCPYVYEKAVSPHLASKLEGNPVDMDVVKNAYKAVCENHELVIMEGSGGILCPIRFDEKEIWLEDIIKEFDLPCLLVADAGLGTINQVVLTERYMHSKNIKLTGILFNHFHPGDEMEEDNIRMCEYMTGLKVLGCIKDNEDTIDLSAEDIAKLFR